MKIASARAFVDGTFVPATITIADGIIIEVSAFDERADIVLDADEVLLPGLVDSHVHLNEPGRTHWEGFASGTAAAAAGGVTTVFDMPLNSIPVTTTVDALTTKREAAAGQLAVNVGFWGGAVPDNTEHLVPLIRAGAVGVKCFLAPSGIDEFQHLNDEELVTTLEALAEVDGLLIVHAEDEGHLSDASGPSYRGFLASRPPSSEVAAVRRVIAAAQRTGARVHIVHVSAAEVVAIIREAQRDGVRITCETCPHYLTLRADRLPDGDGRVKCCPPIRDEHNQDELWEGVRDGTICAIVSDHSPATEELKAGPDLGTAWGGIAGLQTGLSAVWTEGARRGFTLEELVPLMTTGPAALVGRTELGQIAVGAPAHIVAFAPDAHTAVEADELLYRNKMSPWSGQNLRGIVRSTIVNGVLVYAHDRGLVARGGTEILGTVSELAARQ